jgi:protein O-GlcNAc transferase
MLREAVAMHQSGRLADAQAVYRRVLSLDPANFDALHLMGVIALQSGEPAQAVATIARALAVNPKHPSAHYHHGMAQEALKDYRAAVKSYDQAVRFKPDYTDAYNNRGNALMQLQDYKNALMSYSQAVKFNGGAAAYNNRGNALKELQRYDEALASYDRALQLNPVLADAYNNRGNVLRALSKHQDALSAYDSALRCAPTLVDAHKNRGNTLAELERYDEAVVSYDGALRLVPDDPETQFSRAAALRAGKRDDEALTGFDAVLARAPAYARAHHQRGTILRDRKDYSAALAAFNAALQYQPDNAQDYYERGLTFLYLEQHSAAIADFDQAIALKHDLAEAYLNRGVCLDALKAFEAALENYDAATRLDPARPIAHGNRGHALSALKRREEALAAFRKALDLQPDCPFLYGLWLHLKMQFCDWTDLDDEIAALIAGIERGQSVTPSFPVLALTDSLPLQRKAAEIWAQAKRPADSSLGTIAARGTRDKIRLGYYSADYHDHATAFLMAELFERHDREKFEVIGLSFGPDKNDAMRQRLVAGFDTFLDVREKSDRAVAELSRAMEIDIAVDLKGSTQDDRAGIFALRAAPIQAQYIGYPGTLGVGYMDYLIADGIVVPESDRIHYAEKIVELPHCYQVNDRQRAIAEKTYTRAELGLPEKGFVFCCFNNSYKILPETFDGWMRILKQVEGSVLWLLADSAVATANLRREAEARGVAGERLVFAHRVSVPEHLARHRMADLFLDTLPYNAHTTASDALWTGLPILTRVGGAFASRVVASLLRAIDLRELITISQVDYEVMAVDLAQNPARLQSLKQRLADNRLTTPLFDSALFARHIEAGYKLMMERHRAGLEPDHITVAP